MARPVVHGTFSLSGPRRPAFAAPVSSNVRPRMRPKSLGLLDDYIAALRKCLELATDFAERNCFFLRLAAAGEMRTRIEEGDIATAFSILSDERRSIERDGMYGPGTNAAHDAFLFFAESLKTERLAGFPDAGFGH